MPDTGKQRWKFFFEQAPVGMIEWDEHWHVISWNPEAEKIFGWKAEEVIGKSHEFIVPEDIRGTIRNVVNQVSSRRGGFRNSNKNITKSGELIDCEWYNTPLVDESGRTIGAASVVQDVTEQLETRKRLVASSQQLSNLNAQFLELAQSRKLRGENLEETLSEIIEVAAKALRVSRTACWLISGDGLMRAVVAFDRDQRRPCTSATLSMSAFPRFFQALEAERVISAAYATLDERTKEFADEYLIPRGITSKLAVAIRLGGRVAGMICFEDTGPPHPWLAGEQVFASAIADLAALAIETSKRERAEAAQKRLEEQLFQSRKMEALGTLAGGIAHDFNNILAAILGSTELGLLRAQAGQSPFDQLNNVNKAAHRGREIVQQILTFSRNQPLEQTPIVLQHSVEDSLRLIRSTLPEHITLKTDLQVPDAVIRSSQGHLHQALMNLCGNAAHACGHDGGTVTIRLSECTFDQEKLLPPHPQLAPGRYVCLTVEDTGSGMEERTLRSIFDPFFTTKEPGQGIGLGLSIVHSIMSSHNGAVTVETELGQGSKFHLYFPMAADASVGDSKEAPLIFGNGERILLIEDDPEVLEANQGILAHLGYSVAGFNDPHQALEAFQSSPHGFEMVITDLVMPTMSGIEVIKRIRAMRSSVPVLLTTGYDYQSETSGMDPATILQKPFVIDLLARAIADALKVRS